MTTKRQNEDALASAPLEFPWDLEIGVWDF
jgi:hypothetical protein